MKVMRRAGSPYWYLRFHDHGKDVWLSTKETKKSVAEEAAKKLLDEYRGECSLADTFDEVLRGLTRIEDDAERDNQRRHFVRLLMQGTTSKLALADAWDAWLVNPRKKNKQPKQNTLAGYRAIWKRFKTWSETRHKGTTYLHEVTVNMAEDYAADVWSSGVSPATYNAHIKLLASMFKVLAVKGGIDVDPWAGIAKESSQTESHRNLTDDELKRVCGAAYGDLRFWFAIGLYTGLRLADVIHMKWTNIDFKAHKIDVMPRKTERRRKLISCPLHPVLEALLRELRDKTPKDQEYLFPQAVLDYGRDRTSITDKVQAYFVACGIQTTESVQENGHRKRAIVRVGFHSLRHSFVSLCAANRVPQVAIMEMVGHGSPAMTALYSHAGDEQKAKAIAALPDVKFGTRENE